MLQIGKMYLLRSPDVGLAFNGTKGNPPPFREIPLLETSPNPDDVRGICLEET